MNAIEVNNVTKIYKLYNSPKDRMREILSINGKKYHHEFHALNQASLKVEKGETVGIIGQNGSGKSTLLKIICGVTRHTSGSVQVNGRISALLDLGAGFHPEFTGRENVYMNGALMGFSRDEMNQRFPDIETFAEIGEFINQPVKSYSNGMFVRLAFAGAINVDPDILVLDEALAVGDTQFQLKCIEKMKEFKKSGKTIIFVTHDIYSVRNFCDRAIWMHKGMIKLTGDTISVTDAYTDFMKFECNHDNSPQVVKKESKNTILSIGRVRVMNSDLFEASEIEAGDPFSIKVEYKLHEDFEDVVGGVAIYSKDNTYVCGLNTKLDNVKLPSKKGNYQLMIHYTSCTLLPGTYYIYLGFFESTAIVNLDFKSRAQYFYVSAKRYKAEGLCLLDHHWEISSR
jgi:teichoic acid transport system ATP-binding protein